MSNLLRAARAVLFAGALFAPPLALAAAPTGPAPDSYDGATPGRWDLGEQLAALRLSAISLPLAAVLGTALAFRPRRAGTPPRSAPVIQTQIILAIVGAVVMLIVGASLARAFGIVGAASLIRYRAKIDDPKDAGVMLTSLTVGLAAGVGLYALALFGTVFVLGVLWIVESLEPERHKVFLLKIKAKDPAALKTKVEDLLRRAKLTFELRASAADEVSYEVALPLNRRTDRLSNAILAIDESGGTEVEWEEKKVKG
jgi:uncharacterized membrane protein YhiD involved in acid resistance